MEIYLIKHTTPKITNDVCYGQSDLDLANTAEKDIKHLHDLLHSVKLDHIFSSPLKRCMKLANSFDATVQAEERLKELNFGDWEMKTWKEISLPKANQWKANYITAGPPNGESYEELKARVVEIFKGIISQNRSSTGIITHAGPIRAILSFILNLSIEDTFTIKINHGSITKITVDQDVFSVDYVNMR